MHAASPTRIGRYRLGPTLGKGGTGVVYEATLEGPGGFEKRVALKVFDVKKTRAAAGRDQMFREARLGALLRHPNLVDTYEIGEADGHLFIAMELVDGPTVGQLTRERLLPVRAALEIARQMCAGLAHAHQLVVKGQPAAVVHRDIKPSNVLVGRTGLVKIADLGIAHLEGASERVEGTRGYMSPEQCAGKPLDARSDLFSLGVLLWSMVLGKSPLRAPTTPKTFLATMNVEQLLADSAAMAPLERLHPGLPPLISRCLRLDPADRYPDARSLGRDLRAMLRQARGPTLLDILYDDDDSTDADSAMWVQLPAPNTVSLVREHLPSLQPLAGAETPFVGRGAQRTELASLRHSTRSRWVTVTGPAGMGKSRLVQETLADEHRVAYVNLYGLHTSMEALSALRSALSLPLADESTAGMTSSFLHSLARLGPLTLVLDNADGVSTFVRALHDEAPTTLSTRFVVTLREPVGLPREQVLALPPLPPRDAQALFEELVDRVLTPEDRAVLPAIVQRLGGLPLALELCASQARSVPLPQLLDGLENRVQLPERASHNRGATVVDTIQWSWSLLERSEQEALSQLAVFEADFSLEGADAVILTGATEGSAWALDLLAGLTHHSLVQTLPDPAEPRFRLFHAVRSFALAALDAPDVTRERHARWMARFGEPSAREQLFTMSGSAHLDHLDAERADLVAACRWAAGQGRADLAGPLFLAAADLLSVRGPVRLGLDLAEVVLPLRGLRSLRAEVLVATAQLMADAGRADEARARLTDAIRIAVRTEDPETEGIARTHRALLQQRRGQHAAALQDARRATEQLEGRNQRMFGVALANLGLVHRLRRNLQAAAGSLDEALRVLEQAGDVPNAGIALGTLGNVHRDAGRLQEAEACLRQSIALHRRCGNVRSECVGLSNLGSVLATQNRLDEAEVALQSALELSLGLGHTAAEAVVSSRLGEVLHKQGKLDAAYPMLQGALASLRRLGDERAEAEALEAMATLQQARGQPEPARASLRAAQAIYRDRELLGEQVRVATRLARLADKEASVSDSLTWVRELRGHLEARGDERLTAPLLVEEARLLHRQGDLRGARMALIAADELMATAPRTRRLQERAEAVRRLVDQG